MKRKKIGHSRKIPVMSYYIVCLSPAALMCRGSKNLKIYYCFDLGMYLVHFYTGVKIFPFTNISTWAKDYKSKLERTLPFKSNNNQNDLFLYQLQKILSFHHNMYLLYNLLLRMTNPIPIHIRFD